MSIKTWVSDELHEVLGFTAPAVVEYLLAHAAEPSATAQSLSAFLLDSAPADRHDRVDAFASALLQRVAKKAVGGVSATSAQQQRDAERKKALLRKNASFALVDDAGEDEEEQHRRGLKAAKERERIVRDQDKVKRRERKTDSSSVDHDDERRSAPFPPAGGKPVAEEKKGGDDWERRTEEDDGEAAALARMSDAEKAEYRKQKDIAERDAFIERLTAREQAKTKRVITDSQRSSSSSSSSSSSDAKAIEGLSVDEMKALLPELRRKAREHYLTRREQQQLELLRLQLEDEQTLFKDEELTEKEKRELAKKRELLTLAQARKGLSADVAGYHMPEAYTKEDGSIDGRKRRALLEARYVEEPGRRDSEQDGWERDQKRKSDLTTGSRDQRRAADDYGLVFDSSIDFVRAELIEGTDPRASADAAVKDEKPKALSEHEAILANRRQLPIFPYREKLLEAIRDYQVVIVVGETGSGKCFARGTRLRLVNGDTVAVEDVVGGEQLMGDDGLPRTVTPGSLSRGVAPLYRISPTWDGARSFTVNGAHILVLVNDSRPYVCQEGSQWVACEWELNTDSGMRERRQSFDTQCQAEAEVAAILAAGWAPLEWEPTVEEFLQASATVRGLCKLVACKVITFTNPLLPTLQQVLTEELGAPPSTTQLGYMAWWLGMWLTDGDSGRPSISQGVAPPPDSHHHHDILDRLRAYQGLFHEPVAQVIERASSAGWEVLWFNYGIDGVAGRVLRRYGLLGNKQHIPRALICDSLVVRQRLLAGVIDGNGCCGPRSAYELNATDVDLITGCKELAASLGLRNSAVVAHTSTSQQTRQNCRGHCLTLSGDMRDVVQYCAATRKECPQPGAVDCVEKTGDSRYYGFSIDALPAGEYFGFAVHGGDNRRFLLEDYTVTHNVNLLPSTSTPSHCSLAPTDSAFLCCAVCVRRPLRSCSTCTRTATRRTVS